MKSNKIIEELSKLSDSLKTQKDRKVIAAAVLEITRLEDENQSVWSLIEEMKKSDIKNYKDQLKAAMTEKALSALTLMRNKNNDTN